MNSAQTRFNSTLAFIDAGLENYSTLRAGVAAGTEVFVLDRTQDGIEQITQVLAQRSGIEAVHILAHGAPGTLYLGNAELSLATLNRYSWALQSWFGNGSPQLALYGCHLAQGDAGAEFIQKLQELTGAVIYSSQQQVGATSRSNRWDLEVCSGQRQALSAVFEPQVLEAYQGVLGSGTDGSYRWVDSQEAGGAVDFTDISSTGSIVSDSGNEDWMQKVSLPFQFNFYGSGFSEVGISSNGAMLFNAAALNAATFTSNNTTLLPSNTPAYQFGIFPLWDDWKTNAAGNAAGKVYSQTLGTGNNRRFVVQWDAVSHFVEGGDVTFQAVLHEGSNNVDFVYEDTFIKNVSEYNYGSDATIALNKDANTAIEYSTDQPSLSGVTSIRFLTEPRIVNNKLTLLEGETVTLKASDLSALDVDNADNPDLLRFDVSAVEHGRFQLNDTDATSFTLADINAGKVKFIHDGNEFAPSYRVIATDGINSSTAQAAAITYTAVSDPAMLSDLTSTVTVQENALSTAAALLDSAVTLADVDSTDFKDGQLLIRYGNGGGAEDQLSIRAAGALTLNGRDLSFNGQQIGAVDAFKDGSNGKALAVNFTSTAATLAAVQSVIQSLSYRNLSDQPAFTRALAITLDDGDGAISEPVPLTIQVNPENDLPVTKTPEAETLQEDTPFTFTGSSLISVTDPDSSLVRVALSATQGTLSLSGSNGLSFTTGTGANEAAISFAGSQSAINVALAGMVFKPKANYHGSASVQIKTDDLEGGTATTNTINLTVSPVNDAPINALPVAQAVDEDTDLVFSSANGNSISISDLDINEGTGLAKVTLSVTKGRLNLAQTLGLSFLEGSGVNDAIMTFVGTVANVNAALNGLRYCGNRNVNGSDQLTITTSDQGNFGGNAQIDSDALNLSLRPVDDMPVISGTPATSIDEKVGYSFMPTVDNVDGDALTFTIINKPSWASFDAKTGRLSGVPDTVNAGTVTGIRIGVSDGISTVSLPEFSLTVLSTTINGLPSADLLTGNEKNNTIRGQQGNDIISGQTGNDVIYGDEGDDTLDGGAGDDVIYGGDGNDALTGGSGSDILYGDAGNNSLLGGVGDDLLTGGDGNDYLDGGDGNDRIYGRNGNDRLVGGNGNDLLDGGTGKNTLQGNAGADIFVLTPKSFAKISDFQDKSDRLTILGMSGKRAFGQLEISQKGRHTVLEFQNQKIAELSGITPKQITASDFVKAL